MRSNPVTIFLFIFQLENILRTYLKLLTSYGRYKVHIRVIISEFYMAWRKNSLKYLLIGGGKFVPPCPNGADIAYVQTA